MFIIYSEEPIPKRPENARSRRDHAAGYSTAPHERRDHAAGYSTAPHERRDHAAGYSTAPHERRDHAESPLSPWNFITEEELYAAKKSRTHTSPDLLGGSVPEKIRKMLQMMSPYKTQKEERDKAFLEQARFMEDYEDDFVMNREVQYHAYPVYQELSLYELRGYFSWRTQLKKGHFPKWQWSFYRIRCAELFNLVGAPSAKDAFFELLKLMAWKADKDKYSISPSFRNREYSAYLGYFIIFHDLDRELALEYCIDRPEIEEAMIALSRYRTVDDYTLYNGICTLAAQSLRTSRFSLRYDEDTAHIVSRVYRKISEIYGTMSTEAQEEAKERSLLLQNNTIERPKGMPSGSDLTGWIIGSMKKFPVSFFENIPFSLKAQEGFRYRVDPVRTYEFVNGKWFREGFYDPLNKEAIQYLASLVRECERLMRKAFHYKGGLKKKFIYSKTSELIQKIIEEYIIEKTLNHHPEVKIDVSKLSDIRADAAYTRDQLLEGIVEGDDPCIAQSHRSHDTAGTPFDLSAANPDALSPYQADISVTPPGTSMPESASDAIGIFSEAESEFLHILLNDGQWKQFIANKHLILSVLIDSINEKAYEFLGDSIVELKNTAPIVIEDYHNEILGMLGTDSRH